MANDNQMTITIHVDDVKASHKDPNKITKFAECLNGKCGKIGKLKIVRGKKHRHLGMNLDHSEKERQKLA